jgi:hypothetical protein
MNRWIFFILLVVAPLYGCTGLMIDSSINAYDAVATQVQLGDQKEKVLAILLPAQKNLSKSASKRPDQYIKDGVRVEIYYMRSSRQPDGLTTDDEFTPYIFNDSVLVGIGWAAIGGPKTQGQTTPNVNVQQKVIVH